MQMIEQAAGGGERGEQVSYNTVILLLHYIRLTAFFQDNLGKPAPEKQNHSGKTNLDLLKQEIVSGSGISWVICSNTMQNLYGAGSRANHQQCVAVNHAM